jgi:hAT family C-terminal dimerisation region
MFDNMPFLSVPKKAAVVDELARYLASPTEATEDPLLWWTEKRMVYPRLARMALNYLSIPGQFYLDLFFYF